MLASCVGSPAVVVCMPSVLEAMQVELPQEPARIAAWVGGMARALAAMQSHAEDMIRQPQGKRLFASSQEKCVQFLLQTYRYGKPLSWCPLFLPPPSLFSCRLALTHCGAGLFFFQKQGEGAFCGQGQRGHGRRGGVRQGDKKAQGAPARLCKGI